VTTASGGDTRLFLAIASSGHWKDRTVASLVLAVKALGCEQHIGIQGGPYTHWNREELVADAFKVTATHLMFVDTDVAFRPDAIPRLLAHRKDVVGAMYNCKTLPPLNTIKMADDQGNLVGVKGEDVPRELFRCAALPGGFMLIDLARLRERVEPPYFTCEPPTGEDVFFCRKAAAAGLEIWCDPLIPVQHVGDYAY
jgi:hypothetical protein